MRVLLVEDNDLLARTLSDSLGERGFDVDRVAHGQGALNAEPADVVLLDLHLPDANGIDVLQQLRERSETPIIVVTGSDEEIDKVVTLEMGADDYVTKPFSLRELVSRMRAVLRRSGRPMAGDLVSSAALAPAAPTPAGPGPAEAPAGRFAPPVSVAVDVAVPPNGAPLRIHGPLGELIVDTRRRKVTVDTHEVALTVKEFDLLVLLAAEPGSVIDRSTLMCEVWDEHWFGSTKTLDIHVASLRKKLGDRRWVETVRGVGYRLAFDETFAIPGTGGRASMG